MRIFVIGGTRFVGPEIVRRLSADGHEVTVFHRGETQASLPTGVTELIGDRNRLSDHASEVKRLQPDVVVDMVLLKEAQALQLVEAIKGHVGRLVAVSSCDVYRQYGILRGLEEGPGVIGRLTEESPLRTKLYPYRDLVPGEDDPLWDYDKIPAEGVVMSQPDLPGTILRFPIVYGQRDRQHRFAPYIRRMTDKRSAILMGDLEAEWRITRGFSENCAAAVCKAVTDGRAAGRIYNVGEETAASQREWVSRIAALVGWEGEIITRSQERLPDHLKTSENWQYHMEIDTCRIRAELGCTEEVSAAEALQRTVDWELANPAELEKKSLDYAAEDAVLKSL